MLSDAYQLGHSVPEYTIVGIIIDDIFKKIIDLISVFSSRFGRLSAYQGKRYLAPVPVVGVP
jgi:hypothetical protein